ncbi:uncharacterized protein CYBJADRAFT_164790 [Cyberlindnera jadinii NRRL Y-1542]|uniref:Uncharacterized protein n=1 Tax=Cyberlindnera jadinii (strain ATCC 18201 / CBS 1600 / BCRC 20928 / JCM 3617 / NBRC 0987 / NRRL Y-1542) TaxID=983966 RepID=A0A1E4RV44_CYBJN|nr:hypothetical protein CYBJADRAFT_164790 [Cyberlindnera jadinii NRRL Y-1542]ODV70945.1 hypothetical protein CYBJADRAFT_164790 [Cyberlindnera jadinii NRRL Y-1542]
MELNTKLNRKKSTSTLAKTISFTHTRAPVEDDVRSPTITQSNKDNNKTSPFNYLNRNSSNSTLSSITHTLSNVGFTSISQPSAANGGSSANSPDSGSSNSTVTSPVLGKVESKLARAKMFAKTKTKELKRSRTLTEGNAIHEGTAMGDSSSVAGASITSGGTTASSIFLKRTGHGHHVLSSSSSNSKVVESGSTMYSFDPSQILDREAAMKQLSDVNTRHLTFDERDQMADNLWATVTNILRPLFKIDSKNGLQLKLPVEDVSRMIETFLKLRIRNNVSATNLVREIMDFFKTGFNVLDNELSFDQGITNAHDYYFRMTYTWEYFFKNIYHYLLAVFEPLDLELSGSGKIVKDKSYWVELTDSQIVPSTKKIVLLAFRDYVVIPYFEMNIDIPELQDRERRLMIQCFGMMKIVQSNTYNQRIIEFISNSLESQLTMMKVES